MSENALNSTPWLSLEGTSEFIPVSGAIVIPAMVTNTTRTTDFWGNAKREGLFQSMGEMWYEYDHECKACTQPESLHPALPVAIFKLNPEGAEAHSNPRANLPEFLLRLARTLTIQRSQLEDGLSLREEQILWFMKNHPEMLTLETARERTETIFLRNTWHGSTFTIYGNRQNADRQIGVMPLETEYPLNSNGCPRLVLPIQPNIHDK